MLSYEVECVCCGKVLGKIEADYGESPEAYNYKNDSIIWASHISADKNPDLPAKCDDPECGEPLDIKRAIRMAQSFFEDYTSGVRR